MIKKKRQDHNKILLLVTNLIAMEVLISRGLIDSYISQSEFVSVSIVLRAYNNMKKASNY